MMITKAKLKELVEYETSIEPSDIEIEGNAIASGDDEYDKKVENKLREDVESGNEWAWCDVKVTATYKDITGTDTLGACSYEDQNSFESEDGGYYSDMKEVALDDLYDQLVEMEKALDELKGSEE